MTMPMTAQALLTVEEWGLLPEDDARELVEGRLVEAEMGTFAHGYVVAELSALLREYFRPRGAWVVGDGVRLSIGERKGRVPDAAVFLERPSPRGVVQVPPAIVVEVLSEGAENHRRDRIAKLDEYAKRGIAQYWIVDPEDRTVEIFALRSGLYARVAAAETGALVVPDHEGLVVDVEALFAGLD